MYFLIKKMNGGNEIMERMHVIKSDSTNDFLVWKHPDEDFLSGSQLIVNPTEEAIFRNNGIDDGPYTEGRYSLTTDNMPGLKKFFTHTENGENPFHCQVFFIKVTEQMGIKWGTDSKVIFIDDRNHGHQWSIGAHGELSIKVSNSRKLLEKLINDGFLHCEKLMDYLRAPIMTYIKSFLPKVLRERGISIFEIDQHLAEFSQDMQNLLSGVMSDYGITLEKYWITEFLKPEDDPAYIKLRDISGRQATIELESDIKQKEALMQQKVTLINKQTEVQAEYMQKQMNIMAEKERQKELGYTYQEGRKFDVMEKLAENEGSGSDLRNAAMGLGMGFGMGGPIGGAFGSLASSTMNFGTDFGGNQQQTFGNQMGGNSINDSFLELGGEEDIVNSNNVSKDGNAGMCFCSNCGAKMLRTAKFCSECGTKKED